MTKTVTKRETFPAGNGPLILKVANFDGQFILTTVRLDTEVKLIASVVNTPLGDSDQCKGRNVFIFSDVRDVLSETDDASLTISINDNTSSKTFFYAEDVPGPGESVSYEVTIALQ